MHTKVERINKIMNATAAALLFRKIPMTASIKNTTKVLIAQAHSIIET
jgi:hypothetical protein